MDMTPTKYAHEQDISQGYHHTYQARLWAMWCPLMPLCVIAGLSIDVPADKIMPVYALFASCGRDWFVDPRTGLLPVTSTKYTVSKSANAFVAPIEAALIHCCQLGSICLNAATHGGLDTLPALAFPPQLEHLRRQGDNTCGKLVAHPATGFDKGLVSTLKRSYYDRCAHPTAPDSSYLTASNALYASVPSRGLHLLQGATADGLKGQSTRSGPFAGP